MQTRLYITPWNPMRIDLFISSVISNKIHNYDLNKIKAFIISLSIHAALLFTLIYSSEEIVRLEPTHAEKTVVNVSLLSSFEKSLPKKSPAESALKQAVVKKPVAKKPLVPKPLVKKRLVQKPILKKPIVQKLEKKTPLKQKMAPQETMPQKDAIIATEALTPSEALTALAKDKPLENEMQLTANESKPALQEKGISPNELGKIRSLIQNSLVYPAIARRMKIEGVVVISFLLSEDGYVESANILTPSGSRTLDAKALKTVLALSGEYPHLGKKTDLQIPISFSLKNS